MRSAPTTLASGMYLVLAAPVGLHAGVCWFEVIECVVLNPLATLVPRQDHWWFAFEVAWALLFTLVTVRLFLASEARQRSGAPHKSAWWVSGAAVAISPILAWDLWLDSQAFSNYGGGCHVQLEFMLSWAFGTAWARHVQEGLAIALVPTVLAAYAGSWCFRRRRYPPNPALQPTPPRRRG